MTYVTQLQPTVGAAATAFLNRAHKLLIGNSWVAARSGQTLPTYDPGTGRQISSISAAGAEDVDAAVAAARRAFDAGPWSKMKPAERAAIMWKIGDLLEQHADELSELETLDNGAPHGVCRYGFVPMAIEQFRYMAGWVTKLLGDTIPLSLPGDWHAYTLREPVGVVGQIIPWNVPLPMAAMKIAPALAAGCTVVLKPAEETSLTALRLGELALEAGLPAGVLNIVTGTGIDAGAAIAAHPDVDKVAFTGSTEVGRLIVQAAAGNLKKVTLELGGKSPAIVFPDADLERAIPGTANGIFFNSGQVCVAGSRLYAHKKIFDRLVDGVAEQAAKVKLGHGLAPETQLGPLISAKQVARVTSYIEAGRRDGAHIIAGGESLAQEGYFIKPTVVTNTSARMSIVREEIFGPVLCAIPFDDDDLEQIARAANDTPYGLGASIWTRDLSVAHKLAPRLRAGTVWINAHNPIDPALPFGGYKQSGWGRESGLEGLKAYTEVKSVAALL
ncbi:MULTISPECIES: aldehyde dehydrogenase family protein [Burkholderia cepacia complex]|uniref:aldehyde dehydrogenase family protein n=1 Tax=Burkholderia cepacia complex TaxID=87882 RepID=UPI001CF20107|nr:MULTISPECIES: aldehyde dehydrogenase family protein [Burkholderia cepacia complex]MCA8057365.1 aldehyde dehydrogenase family protein [Burkholderia cepacia]MDN7535190.1 aldehyde dehydrogenase family protein [Burkholderia orbicola]